MNPLKARPDFLGDLDAPGAARLITAATDVALAIDSKGVIRDLVLGSDELEREGFGEWRDRAWVDTVTVDSRSKVEALLRDAAGRSGSATPWRHVNHPSARGGADIPVLYSAIQVGAAGRVVAVGRNLQAVAALQRRLVEAQQSLEKDYSRMHHAETRYRFLFQMATEAILIVDAATSKVVEANPAAWQLLGGNSKRLVGRVFPEGFDPAGTQALQSLLATVRSVGKADDVRVRMAGSQAEFRVTASLFRQQAESHILVRLAALRSPAGGSDAPATEASLLRVLETSPDGFVVTDPEGRILQANRAFLDLAQLAAEGQARGESLGRWMGHPGADLEVLSANLRAHGSVRLFATTLRGEVGSSSEVEVSAVAVPEADPPCVGYTIRSVARRLQAEARTGRELPRSVEQLTELIGRVPLRDLVRETTDVIERMCIEAALELTGDNRASAAEMLGLSRQSLYVKLRRYGLGELESESADEKLPEGGR